MNESVLLQVEDVWVERPGAEVLRGVNLRVRPDEVHVLLGLNGSGKTSLALTLLGAAGYSPARGHILFDGQDITSLSVTERARLGLTLAWQEPARFEGLLVGNYLAPGMRQPTREYIAQAGVRLHREMHDYDDRQRCVGSAFHPGVDGCWYGCTMVCAHAVDGYEVCNSPYKGQRVIIDGPEYETIAAVVSCCGIFINGSGSNC